ncbi:hypothetical protein [Christiangramia echinicola]|uniref:hypothetical protein n=1 Tax=Christiangramia echinicola TaxID=279359 RepID=UPI0003F538DC|nr:hypothetical protein [Christiangramia echinicola]
MKKLFTLYISGLILLTSCDSGSDPTPTPQPDIDEPGMATLKLPENNKECEQGEISGNSAMVEFSWEEASETESYDLKITNLDNQTTSVKTALTATFTDVSLGRGHPYSWQVISRNSGSITNSSNTWKFYLAGDGESNFAPFPVNALSPTPGATVTPDNGEVSISWEASQDPDGEAVTYTLFADKVDATQEPPANWKNITSTSVNVSVEANTVYYWRVVTSDGSNTSTSSIYTFKTTN